MKTHIDYIQEWYPDLLKKRVLDLGSGLGAVLVELTKRGGNAVGIETNPEFIEMTKARAREAGVSVDVRHGAGETLPFGDGEFDFINMTEVIEHVNDPHKVLTEVYRVLKPGGQAYVSVPNRFAFKDHHYDLILVNWLPRFCAHTFISIFGEHKNYNKPEIGRERLDEMNYYTLSGITKLGEKIGFEVTDLRIGKIKRKYPSKLKCFFAICAYKLLRLFYFESFHIGLEKPLSP